jgi:hypothetical protein
MLRSASRGLREKMGYEYPRWKYHLTKDAVVVNNPNEEAALGVGWADRPLDRYPETRPARNDPQACLKWVDEWSVPNLSAKHRKRIKVHLLKVEAVFCKSPDFSTGKDCMRRAFAGVAEVLFQAGMLSERLLENELREFVMDTAVAGGWWPYASETDQGISSRTIGHYSVWWPESGDWEGLFRGETAEWLARLLAAQPQTARTGANAAEPQPRLAQGAVLDTHRINRWITDEGYDNPQLADKLGITLRAVSSMRNNQKYHGRHAVEKLAKLMQVDAADLYLPVK